MWVKQNPFFCVRMVRQAHHERDGDALAPFVLTLRQVQSKRPPALRSLVRRQVEGYERLKCLYKLIKEFYFT